MKILLSNDDGYLAKGIIALYETLHHQADVVVVAPDRNRSGASNSLTLDNPIRASRQDNGFISVDGTPTDCVHLAITGLLDEVPDMVVAGINAGSNLGDDVIYSGTVAAAVEGRFLGLPAIAVSLVGEELKHYATAAYITGKIIENLKANPLQNDTILNINVPDVPIESITGIHSTRLGNRHKSEPVVKYKDPRGRSVYWVGPVGAEQDAGPGTDFDAIAQNAVSVTSIQVDLTRHQEVEPLKLWLEKIKIN